MAGKRITGLNENIALTDSHKIAIDKISNAEAERVDLQDVKAYVIGKDADKLMLYKDSFIQEESVDYVKTHIHKHFVDYSKYANDVRNSKIHYDGITWRFVDGNNEYLQQFTDLDALEIWFDANIEQTGGTPNIIINKLKVYAFYPVKLHEEKIINITPYNFSYKSAKIGNTFSDYRNNYNVFANELPQATFETIFNFLLDGYGISYPSTYNKGIVTLSTVRDSVYSAFRTGQAKSSELTKYIFQNFESKGRIAYNSFYDNYTDINNILQNYQDPMPYNHTGISVPAYFDGSGWNVLNTNFKANFTPSKYYMNYSMVRFYLLKGTYYDAVENINVDTFTIALKPLGQDYFATRYYDNIKYDLYCYLKSNMAKPTVRKINTADNLANDSVGYIGDESHNLGWFFTKRALMKYLTVSQNAVLYHGNYNRNNKALKDAYFFIKDKATGEISPLSDLKISVKTHMRGSMFSLMLENK